MYGKPNVERLLEDKNAAGLEMAMRFGGDASVRRQAVKAAGRLGNTALVEALNRALREDPDRDVQLEAFQALREILGNRAEEVVENYNRGPAYEDEWLLSEPEDAKNLNAFWEREQAAGPKTGKPNLARILEEGDITGLEEAMRFGPEAKIRQLAARAAGQWGNLELVEALVRSMQEDPDEMVRDEAYEALYEMLGSRTDEVAASYNAGADYADEWIIADPQVELDDGAPAGEWDERSINALYMMADDSRNTAKGVKAVKALAQIGTTRAVEALISLALHAETEKIRQASRGLLEDYYGEDLDEVLKSFQADDESFGEELVDLALEEDWPEEAIGDWAAFGEGKEGYGRAQPQSSPVMREEGVSAAHVLLVGAATLVVIALVAMALR
jgi:HEAT repeat protein